ncbi:single-stranded DNA-binding protein, mitochondrial isoform X1 [Cucumis melo]|uniref:Single-stranded DNA-binding protein, mitochondrial isoform X1 n=1 Tax=Cucumis melo TaxID=3656 RepID=A0ABM3KHC3_CUCME|nr:single-stranded DNA-binding protein, mitochondrial isoform X1 [Cucumis melo]
MNSVTARLLNRFRIPSSNFPTSSFVASTQTSSKFWLSTGASESDVDIEKNDGGDDDYDAFSNELQPQGVDPSRGWGYRGVHKAIICGRVGQAPVQKILRNGRTITIFTVGTGGMYDQRIVDGRGLPKPAQWHRIAVHNELLGAYAVQKLCKNASVYVEGDIETRVYNDSINGEVKNIPEICVRRDGIATHTIIFLFPFQFSLELVEHLINMKSSFGNFSVFCIYFIIS